MLRFLIVEADPMTGSHIQSVIEGSGLQVAAQVMRGDAALAVAAREPISVALVDVDGDDPLPGIAAARGLLDEFGVRSIFLVPNRLDATAQGAMAEARPLGLLAKPFRPSGLVNLLFERFGATGTAPIWGFEPAI